MESAFALLLKNGRIVSPSGIVRADIGVREGRIAAIGDLDASAGREVIDCSGLHVLPGVIDTQVHFREPGGEHKEDLETGSKAAILGGVCGVKVFMGSSTGDLLVADDESLARVLANIRRRAAFHSEDEARLNARKGERIDGDVSSHPVWRDEEAALRATKRLLALAKAAGRRVHVLHVSTAEELPLLAAARDFASVEITPHHLTLAAPEAYERLGTLAQMNPPVRGARHREALWRAVNSGLADVLGSDHAPHLLEEKAKDYPASPSGMPGVQTLVPVMLDHVNAGRLSLSRFVDLMCEGPHRLFQIAGKGRIAQGYDADFTIVDLKARRTITNNWIASRCGWTPYDGMTVTGWPLGTIVRGRRVMWEDEITDEASGAPMRFMETLQGERA